MGKVGPRLGFALAGWLIGAVAVAGFVGSAAIVSHGLLTDTGQVQNSTVATDTLNPPTGLSATGGSSITLNWTATADTYASGHRVLRGTAAGGPYSQIAEVTPRTTTTYTDNPAAGTYYYVLRAFYQNWESVNSSEASATVTGGMEMATGTYSGDGADNRAIAGVGFQPDVVIIKGNTGQVAVMRTSTITGDNTKPLVGSPPLTANLIQSLDANGFTIGNDAGVNSSGISYYWVAFKAAAGEMKVGSYSGNGSSQSITGAGFSAEYVIVLSAGSHEAVHRSSSMTKAFNFKGDAGATDRITSLDADGFSVGSNPQTNASGTTYHYVAWNAVAGKMNVGSYTGDGADNRDITGVGFQPQYLIIKNDAGEAAVHRSASLAGDSTLGFETVANFSDGVQALQADGFQVGTHVTANKVGTTTFWIAFKP